MFVLHFQLGHSSPVLVLVANGSDITINFPGENNNNRVFSIVSSSGNNNPSMLDWIGGNGANKAPTIMLGKSDASAMSPHLTDDNSDEDNSISPSNPNPRWGPQGMNEYDENDGILPLESTVTPKILVNITTSSSAYVETSDKVIAAPV
ncbi:uncharacterized protein LOC128718179 [Anopheles marshallii]|uniref:uncharacterized protein LOC128718179 n=1 Tax=Anopheles marshallii TaxID=1521116 RepID=UPI00237AAD73|nr:uncharacterized protein LOC128718179 [Anopheles marshallii]